MSSPHKLNDITVRGGLYWGPTLGGGFYSHRRATWPFVEMSTAEAGVRIAVWNWTRTRVNETFEFTHAEVDAVRSQRRLISLKLKIEHHKPAYPSRIVFYTFRSENVADTFRFL